MVQSQFRTFGNGFVRQPAFKEMLFQNVPLFGQQFLCPVGENDSDALHVKGFDVVGKFEVEVLHGQFRQTLTAVDRGSDLRVGFQQQRGQACSSSVEGG